MREILEGSPYYGTVNSNISPKDPNKVEKLNKFVDGIKRLFLSDNCLNLIKVLDEEDREIPKEQLIKRIEIYCVFEIGEKKGFGHFHYYIWISHYSTIQFVMNRIMDFFKVWYGLSVWSHGKFVGGDRKIYVDRYFQKTLAYKNKKNLFIKSEVEGLDAVEWLDEQERYFYQHSF